MSNNGTSSKTKIVFFGNERLATGVTTTAPTLRHLIDVGYEVVAVVSHHTQSQSRDKRGLEIAAVAAEHNIPVLLPEKPAEVSELLQAYGADIAVLVAYGKIVPQSVIDIFPHGIINIHPSLLPLHRGPIPIESVILEGAAETGVSVMQLVRAMDAGPVYGQRHVQLAGIESKQQLADRLLDIGGELVIELLPGIIDGSCQPAVQDDGQATYDALITKSDGLLDCTNPAALLARQVRAYHGWPKSRTTLLGTDSIVTQAHAIAVPTSESAEPDSPGQVWHGDKQIGLYTSDGILVIDALKPAGKQEMSAAGFLAGYSRQA